MELEMLAKDVESGKTGCPSVYRTDNGEIVVQGNFLDAATEANLQNVLPGEGAVRIKESVLREAFKRLG